MARRSGMPFPTFLVLLLAAASASAGTLIGCFQDGPKRALVSSRLTLAGSVTVKACSDAARARGLPVYGLARGNECWASKFVFSTSRHVHYTAAAAAATHDASAATPARCCCRSPALPALCDAQVLI